MADPKIEILDITTIPSNSFLVIRVDVPGPMEKYAAASEIAGLLKPHEDYCRKNNISVMIMTPTEGFEIITEADLNSAGWYRKQ